MRKCVAVVTSTLKTDGFHSFFSSEERLQQTINTLDKLTEKGLHDIFLFDNSGAGEELAAIAARFPQATITRQHQYKFRNKGLNEALLLLNNLHLIPDDVAIFKISARYYPNDDFLLDKTLSDFDRDFAGVGYQFDNKNASFSTRAYFARNKKVLEDTLVLAIEEMLAYSTGIHGLRSLFLSLKSWANKHLGTHYQLSVEQSFARILKKKGNYQLLAKIGVEGYVAGSDRLEKIVE